MGKSCRTRSISSGRAAVAVMASSETPKAIEHQPIELRTNRGERDLVDHFRGERISQQTVGGRGRDAAAPGVEPRQLVEPAYGGAVRALHVVGENLELGL